MKETFRAIILRLPEPLISRIESITYACRFKSRSQFLLAALIAQVAYHERQLQEKTTGICPGTRAGDERQHNGHIRGRLHDALNLATEVQSLEKMEEIEKEQMVRVEEETRSIPDGCVATQPFLKFHVAAALAALNVEIERLTATGAKQ